MVSVLVCSCSTPSASSVTADTGVKISKITPPGLRAQQTVDMLNSDWPIGPDGVATLAAPDMVNSVRDTMENLWWERPFTVSGIEYYAGHVMLHLVNSFGAGQDIEIHTDDNGMVNRFEAKLAAPKIASWADVDAELAKSGARYSYQVAKVDAGRCDRVAGTNTAQSLPLASIFKLYVLYAVADAVKAGTVSWDDSLTITGQAKAVGSSGLEKLPAGAKVSVRTAADKMIANSDNMATDLLIEKVGTTAVERALVEAGHHDPSSMTPFPTMHELFSVGWGEPDLRQQWKNAVGTGQPQARAQLLEQTNSRPYEPDPARTHTPASAYGAEWYGSAEDICRVHAALQSAAVGAAARCVRSCRRSPASTLIGSNGRTSAPRPGPARRPDLQLVCGGPQRAGVGGQLPAELAAVSRPERRGLADIDRETGVRNARPAGLTATSNRLPVPSS